MPTAVSTSRGCPARSWTPFRRGAPRSRRRWTPAAWLPGRRRRPGGETVLSEAAPGAGPGTAELQPGSGSEGAPRPGRRGGGLGRSPISAEREAVFARTDLLAAALSWRTGAVTIAEAEREVAALEKAGTLLAARLPGAEDRLTTDRATADETETIALMRVGPGRTAAPSRPANMRNRAASGQAAAKWMRPWTWDLIDYH